MAWVDTLKVINARAIADNLLAWFELKQADAILWANGSVLKPIQRFENSRANLELPSFPAILLSDDNDRTEHGNDYLGAAYTALFLVMVQSDVPATARTQAQRYELALKSMIVNIPQASLELNVGCAAGTLVLQDMAVGYEVIKAGQEGKAINDWMQAFDIRVSYTLMAGAK